MADDILFSMQRTISESIKSVKKNICNFMTMVEVNIFFDISNFVFPVALSKSVWYTFICF